MSRLHGTACQRRSGFFATTLSRLNAHEDRKIVHWCRTQASSHISQGVVDDRIYEVSVRTAAPDRSAVLCSLVDQGCVAIHDVVAPAPQPGGKGETSNTNQLHHHAEYVSVR